MTDNLRTWAERLVGGYLARDFAVPTAEVALALWDIDRILRVAS